MAQAHGYLLEEQQRRLAAAVAAQLDLGSIQGTDSRTEARLAALLAPGSGRQAAGSSAAGPRPAGTQSDDVELAALRLAVLQQFVPRGGPRSAAERRALPGALRSWVLDKVQQAGGARHGASGGAPDT